MKRHLSFLRFFILSFLLFSSCTLYMDDPEGVRVLRTEEGYLETAEMELPDGIGYLNYKYNQKTIAIEDDVERWVVKVESDTIVWFSQETPDYYLPEPGEMMTCSLREKFPHGFCHRCIERTESNGMYRCVFTPCSIADAFDEFEVSASPKAAINKAEEEGVDLTDEQFDSVMYDFDDTVQTNAVSARAQTRAVRTRADNDDEEKTREPLMKKTVKFKEGKLEVSLGEIINLSGSATYGGSLTIEGYAEMVYNAKTKKYGCDFTFEGKLNLWVELEASAGVTLKVPNDICVVGVDFDLGKVAIHSGFYVGPYFAVKQKINGRLDVSWKFNTKFSYSQANGDAKPVSSVREFGSGCSSPSAIFDGTTTPTLNVEAGVDIYLRLGAEALGFGKDAKVGVRFYTELNQDIDTKKYESAEAFRQKNANFPLMAKIYATETTSKGIVNNEEDFLKIDPIKVSDKLVIPFMPVVDKDMKKTYFYCENYKNNRYKIQYKLKSVGLIGYLLDYIPYLRIFNENGDMLKEVKLDLKENLTMGQKTWIDEGNIIQKNIKYLVQIGLKSHGKYWLPLEDIPFTYDWPDVVMYGTEVVALRKGESVKKDYKFEWSGKKTEKYDYMYIIDVSMGLAGMRSIGKWGIDMSFPFYNGVTNPPKYRFYRKIGKNSDMSKMERADVNVRFYWYTNHGYSDRYGNWNQSNRETITFRGLFTVINNGVESDFQYIDNIHYGKVYADVYYDKSMDRDLTSAEINEFKKDPFSYDFLKDNQNKSWNSFSFQDPRTGSKTSQAQSRSMSRGWYDEEDDMVVVEVYE